MNSDSGIVNTDSGKIGKVFTLNQNERSRSAGIGVHDGPEYAVLAIHAVRRSQKAGLASSVEIGSKCNLRVSRPMARIHMLLR